MDVEERRLAVEAIHDAPLHLVLAVAGGGVLAISDLLTVPGGSRTVLEALVPYSQQSLYELMGSRIEPHVSPEAALAMARGCLNRAKDLEEESDGDLAPGIASAIAVMEESAPMFGWETLAGVACTAALATDPPRRGHDRAHLAVVTDNATLIAREITLSATDRAGQDRAPWSPPARPARSAPWPRHARVPGNLH